MIKRIQLLIKVKVHVCFLFAFKLIDKIGHAVCLCSNYSTRARTYRQRRQFVPLWK